MRERNKLLRKSCKQRILVIDLNIFYAANDKSSATDANICSDFLETVRNSKHRIVFSKELEDEWESYEKELSEYALGWRANMRRAKLIAKQEIDVMRDLRSKIRSERVHAKFCSSMHPEEDVHLLEAALQTNKIVASFDDTARRCFASVSRQISEIKEIMWVNPKEESETCNVWIMDCTPVKKEYKLRAYSYIVEQ